MPQSLANFDAALKDDYGPGMRETVNDRATVALAQLTRNTEDIQGRQAVWSTHISRSGSTGGRQEQAVLPSARQQGYVGPREDLAYLYHTIKVTGQAARLTKGAEGAFVQALESEIKRGVKDMQNDVARQFYGIKVSIGGVLYSGAIAAGAITTVAGNVLTFANATAGEFRAFFKGMVLDVMSHTTAGTKTVDGSTGGASPNGEILAIDKANKTITLRNATGAATSNYVSRQGAWDSEINGLQHLMSTQPFAGINPATEPDWQAVNATPAGAEGISEDLLERMHETIEEEGDGSTGELFLSARIQRRKLAGQLQTQKRYDGRQVTLQAGWKGLDVAQGTLAVDKYMPDDKIFLLSLAETSWFVGQDFTWDDLAGGILYKALDDSDAVQGRYLAYVNQVHTNRNSHAYADVIVPAA